MAPFDIFAKVMAPSASFAFVMAPSAMMAVVTADVASFAVVTAPAAMRVLLKASLTDPRYTFVIFERIRHRDTAEHAKAVITLAWA